MTSDGSGKSPDQFDKTLARRGLPPLAARAIEIDAANRSITTELQELQKRRNDASKHIGVLKGRGEDAAELIAEVADLKNRMAELEEDQKQGVAAVREILQDVPNLPSDDVPDGENEDDNIEIRVVGDKPALDFEMRDHVDVGENSVCWISRVPPSCRDPVSW